MTRDTGRRAGLTFVEYIFVAALLALVGTFLTTFSIQQSEFMQVSVIESDVHARAQISLQAITNELRHSTRESAGSPPNVSIPVPPGNTTLTLYLPTDADGNGVIVNAAGAVEWDTLNAVQYQYVPAARQLVRVAGATTHVLTNDVTGVAFEDQSMDGTLGADEVRVRLTLARATPRGRILSMTATAVVALRN